MAYKEAGSNSFAEYQMGEGFGSAVTGEGDARFGAIGDVAAKAKANANKLPAGLQGLDGYEGYPASYAGFEDIEEEFAGELGDIPEASARQYLQLDLNEDDDVEEFGEVEEEFAGFGDADDMDAFAGYDGADDMDAFAGYELGGVASLASKAKRASGLEEEDEDDLAGYEGLGSLANDGYGSLEGQDLQSFHTFFHKASMAPNEIGLIDFLAKAVKSVKNSTPMSVRKDYFDMAMEMIKRRKATDLRYIDLERVELESNIGWLVNPSLPKTGGFDAMLSQAIGTVGAKIGKGDQDWQQMMAKQKLGKKLKTELSLKRGGGALQFGKPDFGDFEGATVKYVGLGLLGLLAALGIWYYITKKSAAPVAAKKKRRKRSRKRRK